MESFTYHRYAFIITFPFNGNQLPVLHHVDRNDRRVHLLFACLNRGKVAPKQKSHYGWLRMTWPRRSTFRALDHILSHLIMSCHDMTWGCVTYPGETYDRGREKGVCILVNPIPRRSLMKLILYGAAHRSLEVALCSIVLQHDAHPSMIPLSLINYKTYLTRMTPNPAIIQ